jgi:chemotaxis protein CheZ
MQFARDFQDSPGRVLQKVLGIISVTESPLLTPLMPSAPKQLAISASAAELAGPRAVRSTMQQNDVNDLLASLGF